MGDLFDDFMKELRRRQAAATGRPLPNGSGPTADDDAGDDDSDDPDHEEPTAEDAASSDDDSSEEEPRPITLRPSRRRANRDGRQAGGERRPPPPRTPRTGVGGPGDGGFSIRSRLTTIVVVAVVIFVILMFAVGINLWTDAIWYRSVGFDQVFWSRLGIQGGLFALGAAVALIVLLGNLWLAGRLSPAAGAGAVGGGTLRSWIDRLNEAAANADPGRSERSQWDRWNRSTTGEPANVTPLELPDPVPLGRTVIIVIAVFAALGIAGTVVGSWETIVLWQHRVPFDPSGTPVVDPVFHLDISFFLFDLPFLRLLQTIASGLLIASLIVAGGRYLLAAMAGASVFDTRVRVHLGVLAGLFLMTIALGYQLDKLELVHSDRGIATGVSFTDENAQFLAYNVLTVVSAIAAALLVGGAFARVLWPLGLTLAVWFIASIAIGRLYPAAIQYFTVNPNQQSQEQPYIANNIAMTRLAFGLDTWKDQPYQGNAKLTPALITDDADTFANARLWDYRPLGDTLDQLQTVRQYYDFVDVDTDRYVINDQLRQVMLSARELAIEKNPDATGWVNQRIVYTHGVGAAMVPVNAIASQGQPQLFISNLPPVSVDGAPPITQPNIYFGEGATTYSVVDARQPEFDYQRGVGDVTAGGDTSVVTTRWTGKSGIALDTTLSRLLFSLRFRDFNLLISDQVTSDSQLLFHRNIKERVPLIAPFLRYDKDPYLVIDTAGRMKYIQDAFTTSGQFPHAEAFDPTSLASTGLGSEPFNYIRNSVKIVTDAYDGSMTFYVADDADPLIRAWEGVFPSLFHPLSELPADLVPHLRVPEELFDVQTRMFGAYHVTDPATFYSKNDLWTVPAPSSSKQSLPNEAYYVVMRMPGATKTEFLLLQPMIPKNRPNMIGWVAAQNDPGVRGKTTVFRFPSESSIFGPAQVEAQIDADPVISAQVTLWNQSGSTVVRGNLIVVPVGGSLIYLQPVYLQSESTKFPAFQRIVVASPRNIVWGTSLQEALNLLLAKEAGGGGGPGPSPSPGPTPTPGPSATPAPGGSLPPGATVQQLIDFANVHYELAQQALRDRNLAQYQAEIDLVGQAIAQAQALTGGASPAPSLPAVPSAAPSAAP